MGHDRAMECISAEELTEYFDGVLSDERERTIELHFAECLECTALARRVRALGLLTDAWTPEAHAEAYLRALLAGALRAAEEREVNPAWRERLARWRERWGATAEAAVRLVMRAPEEASRIITEGLEAVARPGAVWRFEAAPARILGPGEEAPPEPLIALAPGKPQGRIIVSGEARQAQVRVDDLEPGQPAPLVMLVPVERAGEALVKEPERARGVDYLIARFEDVEPAEYVAFFEPMEGRRE